MVELLRKCLEEDDAEAWADLWMWFLEVAACPVRRLLLGAGFSEEDAEDVGMEISADLFAADTQRLRSFRGQSEVQLHCWWVRVATNYARNWIDHRLRAARRQREAFVEHATGRSASPTEQQIRLLLDELEALATSKEDGLSKRDVKRLRILAGLEPTDDTVSERTLRRWRQTLGERVRKLSGDELP